jgi:uncharacterized Fe-S cluster-containing radical SAM superfamily protein
VTYDLDDISISMGMVVHQLRRKYERLRKSRIFPGERNNFIGNDSVSFRLI